MDYKRFSQLWDALITHAPKLKNRHKKTIIDEGCSLATTKALIEYGKGNKSKIESIRKFLKSK
jgi:hypothetical protein